MESFAVKRIMKDIAEVFTSEWMVEGTDLEVIDDHWFDLRCIIKGPLETPYEGGTFQLEIKIPETYPFSPPKVRFLTNIWHPNVLSQTGDICLFSFDEQWTPAISLRTMLLSIQALLAAAEPNDPLDGVIAAQYKGNIEIFNETAKHWTNIYAGGPNENYDFDEMVNILVDLDVKEHEARVALSTFDWDLERATDFVYDSLDNV